jgi:hypothetical protein
MMQNVTSLYLLRFHFLAGPAVGILVPVTRFDLRHRISHRTVWFARGGGNVTNYPAYAGDSGSKPDHRA